MITVLVADLVMGNRSYEHVSHERRNHEKIVWSVVSSPRCEILKGSDVRTRRRSSPSAENGDTNKIINYFLIDDDSDLAGAREPASKQARGRRSPGEDP